MKYGYIRDSKNNETYLQTQKERLHRFNLDTIIIEPNGKEFGEGFKNLLNKLQPGDELYIDHVSRISRHESKFLEVLDVLIEKNITLYESGNLVDKQYIKAWLLNWIHVYGGNEYEEDE